MTWAQASKHVYGRLQLALQGEEGGTLKIGTADLFTEPWNSIAGSNWVWDSNVMRATTQGTSVIVGGGGLMGDPFTGLAWPQRFENARTDLQEGLPIAH